MKLFFLFITCFAVHIEVSSQLLNCKTNGDYGNNTATGQYADLNGISMYYETYGQRGKRPLLLIHGNGGSVKSAGCQIEAFREDYFIVVPDSRCQGKSGDGTEELTYRLMANDYYKLLNHLGLDSLNIIGQSDGAIIGLLLAIEYPSKVHKLVAAAPNLRPDSTALFAWNIEEMKNDLQKAEAKIRAGDTSTTVKREKALTEKMLKYPNITIDELHTIKAPVLLVFGDSDYMPFGHISEIYQNIPRSNLLIVPGAGHRSYRLEPALFNLFAKRFFDNPFQKPSARNGF